MDPQVIRVRWDQRAVALISAVCLALSLIAIGSDRAGAATTVVLEEGFGGAFPPTGWSVPTVPASNMDWAKNTNCTLVFSDACMEIAGTTDATDPKDIGYIALKNFSTSGLTDPKLEFAARATGAPTFSIAYRLEGETQFERALTAPTLTSTVTTYTVSLDANQSYDVAFGFESSNDPADVIQIDSVRVYGTTADPPVVVDTPPTANDVSVTAIEDQPTPVTLQGHDGQTGVQYSVLTQPANGTLSGGPRTYTYTPKKDYYGTDTFTYKVNDGTTDSNTATVTINVTAINDPPVITMPAIAGTKQGQSIFFSSAVKRAITVADVESEAENLPVDFYIAAAAAPATLLGDISGLTFTSGDGADDRSMSGSGTIPAINAALTQVRVDPPKSFTGTANLTVGIDDRGQTGFGGLGPVENHTPITVSSGPDASVSLPDRPRQSQVGMNVFDDTGESQTLNTDVCFCVIKVNLLAHTAGLTQEDVSFKVETVSGDMLNYYFYEGQDNVSGQVKKGTFERPLFPGFYGGRGIQMQMSLKRAPTNPDEEQVLKFTVTSIPGSNDPEPATSDVVLIKVKARNYKPDLVISESGQEGGAIGHDRYETVFSQGTLTPPGGHQQHLSPRALQVGGNAASVNIWIHNDGTAPDTYDLQGDTSGIFTVIYYDRFGRDITSQIASGNYKTPELEPKGLGGSSHQVQMVILARQAVTPGYQERLRFRTATPGHSDGDIVSVLAEVAQDIQPDLTVVSLQTNSGVGGGKYAAHFGEASTLIEPGEIGFTSKFEILLDNTNPSKSGRMRLQGYVTEPGFSVKFLEKNWTIDPNSSGPVLIDVTNQMKNGSYEFDLAHNRVNFVIAEVTTLPTANPFGFPNQLRIHARSLDGLPRNQDHVIVEMAPHKYQPDITAAATNHGNPSGAGNDIYGIASTTGPQHVAQNIGAGETATYFFNIANDGRGQPDPIWLQGTTVPHDGYTIKWFDRSGTTDITSQIANGSYQLNLKALSPGVDAAYQQYSTVRAVVKAPDDTRSIPPQIVALTATSSKSRKDPRASDAFVTTTTMAYRPDLVLTSSNRGPVGHDVYSRDASIQKNTDNLKVGVLNQKGVAIVNDGTLPDSYLVTITPQTGMKVTMGTNTTVGNTFTTGVVQPGQLIFVRMMIKLPSTQEIDTTVDMKIEVKSVTRPGAHGDSGTMTYVPKFECIPNSLFRGNITMRGNCVQVTDDGWLISGDFTINRLDFSFGSKVAFIDSTTMNLTARDMVIKYGGSNVVIYDKPGPASLPLTTAGGTLVGDGTPSSVYGMQVGAGNVVIKFPSSNTAEVGLPLRPIPVFGGGAASQPFTVPATGGPPPAAPPARTTLTFPHLRLGPFNLAEVTTVYDQSTSSWLGYGRAGFPQLPIPKVPTYEMAMRARGGTLDFAYLRLKPGVVGKVGPFSISKLEATVNLNPTNVVGSLTAKLAETPVTIPGVGEKNLPLFSVDGKFAVSGYQFSVKGSAKLLSLLEFGSFQATYEYGGVARMTAVLNHSIDIGIGTLGVRSEVDGSVDTSSGRFQIQGDGNACLGRFCAGISAILSSKGAAACGRIDLLVKTVGVGFGVKWKNASIQGFTGCNLDDYKDVDAPAHVDFTALEKSTEDLLTKADNVRQGIAAANAAMRSVNLPSLPSI